MMKCKTNGLIAASLAVSLATLLSSGNAGAQAIVNDPALNIQTQIQNIFKNAVDGSNWLKTAKSYADQYSFYVKTYQQYKQQLINAQRLLAAGNAMKVEFNKVPLTEGMSGQCGDASFTNNLVQQITGISLEGDVMATARQVCKQIVANQNSKHNEVVDWLNDVNTLQKEYVSVLQERDKVATEEGKLAANTNELSSLLAKMQNRGEYMRTRVAGFDSNIEILSRTQSQLAKRALNGNGKSGNAFGSVLFGN